MVNRLFCGIHAALAGCALVGSSAAATYHVSFTGIDTNSGTADSPWRTIQQAASVLQPGDTAIVHAGSYDERISTVRGGSEEAKRITFQADGVATMRGFSINHPFITVDGFDITRHSAPSRLTGFIEVRPNGDFANILNNTVRDGISLIRTDFVLSNNSPAPSTISSATGGFLAAGFRAGMTVRIMQKERAVRPTNSAIVSVESLTDQELILSSTHTPFNQEISDEGPLPAYLSGSPNFGLVVDEGASSVIVRSNHFSNLSFDAAWAGGANNLYERNVFEMCNGFNAVVYSGQDNIFRRNWIHSSPSVVYITSPDAMENWSASTTTRLVFEENFVEDFEGPLGVHHLGILGSNSDLIFRSNVFVNAGPFVVGFPNTLFINNTFYSISRDPMTASGPELHAINFQSSPGRFSGEGAVLKNNIFVDCGDATKNFNLRGWYDLTSVTNYTADYNFVAGEPPGFAAKTGFNESRPELNGGNPGFVDIDDPLGPDGLPFTEDDGLRLRSDSKLRGAGEGGMDLGAYAVPCLVLTLQGTDGVRLTWPASADGYKVQSSQNLSGDWASVPDPPTVAEGFKILDLDISDQTRQFFRLTR